jgi:hypothetical protein
MACNRNIFTCFTFTAVHIISTTVLYWVKSQYFFCNYISRVKCYPEFVLFLSRCVKCCDDTLQDVGPERQNRRWVDNIKLHHRDTGWDGVDWVDLAQNRDKWKALANTVMNLRVP